MFEPSFRWVNGILPYRLALMPRPRGGEWLQDELIAWSAASVNSVVSLLEMDETRELELQKEAFYCAEIGLKFFSFPIKDRGVPESYASVNALIEQIYSDICSGNAVAIHCRAGIGRTGLVAGCLLHKLQITYENIFPMLSLARGVAVPDTHEQVDWVKNFTLNK